ncbi:DUF1624 domain-containing protein [Larkinella rosea]|uniref:DUF1624 domain-containing protein n=1 Tax=Larkinella rosea TaxID=2025312 RepID=A0A3P1BDW2_9BACT|nr:heparan-alpha-glucosaminide N-acetyltransferase domain-containing protein [Larkinella rosea]RRA99085.1 DUF1624 domain-containing protein [Larkinella rosea]
MTATATLPLNRIASRIQSIDVLRGIVMVIMALDHTRDFIHYNGFFYNATDLNTTTPALFLTRWVTHFCAPTFVFLAGTSAYLMGRKMTKPQLGVFLMTRGLWLIFLELTVVGFVFWFDLTYSLIALEVIWATGVGMVVLAALLFLPQRLILAIGLLILAGHNALDGVSFEKGTAMDIFWSILHRPGPILITPTRIVIVMYPVLPWIGIMILGYCLGELFSRDFDAAKRRRMLKWIGISAMAGFVLIRALNVYGDPAPWSVQKTPLFTFLSFINLIKYPPSLLFTLVTLGPAMLLLSWLDGQRSNWTQFFIVYGRVPLFYFVVHFFLVHLLSILLLLADGVSWAQINFQNRTGGVMPNHGLSLGMVYGVWVLVVLIMYPLCKGYGRIKNQSRSQIWSYL